MIMELGKVSEETQGTNTKNSETLPPTPRDPA
jgi:hypothetical protein